MPTGLESLILLGLTSVGVSGAALTIGTSILTYGIIGAVGIGLQLLFAPKPPQARPEDMQGEVKQPAQPRSRHYGRVKIAGPWAFAEAKNGTFFKLIVLGQGLFEAIEEYWIQDTKVEVDGTGTVTTGVYNDKVFLYTRLGTDASSSYSRLMDMFPDKWTSDHRLRGLATILVEMDNVAVEKMMETYPQHINTQIRVVARASRTIGITTETMGWTDNAATVIRDYMTHGDGMRLPWEYFRTPLATAMWLAACNRAEEAVSTKDGGSEGRYRIWGSYLMNERPADVLDRFLTTCDGRLYPTRDGGIGLDIGTWREPSVVIDADAITGFSDFSRGKSILDTANTITATYLGVDQDYQTADADPWVDAEDVSARGEITTDLSLIHAPSHGQARRLMKLAAYRANPRWVGTIQCNLRGMAALGERFIRFRYPLFEIDEVFEVADFKLNIGENAIVYGVTFTIQSMPKEAYNWDAAQEEGDAPDYDQTDEDNAVPDPTGFTVTIRRKTMSGTAVAFGALQFDPPGDASVIEARGKATADSQWIAIPVAKNATEAESFALQDGTQYQFEIRRRSSGGRASNWVTTAPITAVGDDTAPGNVTSPAAAGGIKQATISWTSPNSANYRGAVIYRNTVNNASTATAVFTEYGPPSSADSWLNTGLSVGTVWYWIASMNASGVQGSKVATVPASVAIT